MLQERRLFSETSGPQLVHQLSIHHSSIQSPNAHLCLGTRGKRKTRQGSYCDVKVRQGNY